MVKLDNLRESGDIEEVIHAKSGMNIRPGHDKAEPDNGKKAGQ